MIPFLPEFSDSIKVALTQDDKLAVKGYIVSRTCYYTTYGNSENPLSEAIRIENMKDV